MSEFRRYAFELFDDDQFITSVITNDVLAQLAINFNFTNNLVASTNRGGVLPGNITFSSVNNVCKESFSNFLSTVSFNSNLSNIYREAVSGFLSTTSFNSNTTSTRERYSSNASSVTINATANNLLEKGVQTSLNITLGSDFNAAKIAGGTISSNLSFSSIANCIRNLLSSTQSTISIDNITNDYVIRGGSLSQNININITAVASRTVSVSAINDIIFGSSFIGVKEGEYTAFSSTIQILSSIAAFIEKSSSITNNINVNINIVPTKNLLTSTQSNLVILSNVVPSTMFGAAISPNLSFNISTVGSRDAGSQSNPSIIISCTSSLIREINSVLTSNVILNSSFNPERLRYTSGLYDLTLSATIDSIKQLGASLQGGISIIDIVDAYKIAGGQISSNLQIMSDVEISAAVVLTFFIFEFLVKRNKSFDFKVQKTSNVEFVKWLLKSM